MSEKPDQRSWWAQQLLPGGEEPDPRFTLANERTFLAWIRTALAFMAGGVALAAFPVEHVPELFRTGLAVFLIAVGVLIALGAAFRWLRIERAMRHQRPLPAPAIIPVLAGSAVMASVLAIWVFLA
ncbi:YidH family protein [Corynebacterium sp. A21]|uniref:YidH family protein n=1 Tax=Corynebacterium sp. A21 TaxID=3457318 RepID=UPI003FD200A2